MRCSMVSALAEAATRANTSAVTVLRIGLLRTLPSLPATNAKRLRKGAKRRSNPTVPVLGHGLLRCARNDDEGLLLARHLLLAVGDAIDGAVPVVGDQERAILHRQHVD